ncbi:MAG TPA: hypothetical protein VGF28_18725 [Thermoanaerobaculia bacterium]|jgi:hypothetical protein
MRTTARAVRVRGRFIPVIVIGALLALGAVQQDGRSGGFTLSPELPYDVDRARVGELVRKGDIPDAHRLFDDFAWRTFIALNWPANANGQPDPAKTPADSATSRVWEFYRESGTVFLQDGQRPAPWEGSRQWVSAASEAREGDAPARQLWMQAKGDPEPQAHPRLEESIQAFTGPLVDQNGKWVRYEVLMNRTEFDYLYEHQLYSLEGQIAFTANTMVDFPANDGNGRHGAMEVKLAWKQLGANDDPKRFLVREALVSHMIADASGKFVSSKPTLETMGLVGMHIAVKTRSAPTWVWSTFEHVDNVAANDLEKDSRGRRIRPLFFNPDLPVKPVNVLAAKNAAPDGKGNFTSWSEPLTTSPTQVLRVLQIAPATAELNREVREALRNANSVFQYYELIGTQWPVQPGFPAFGGGVMAGPDGQSISSAPESIVFKTPGKVTPTYLINTIMETFFQSGNQVAGPLMEDDRLPAGQVSDPNTVFGTESCVGCHFSAGAAVGFKVDQNGQELVDASGYRVPVFGKNASMGRTGNADYSWLLQMRAKSAPVKKQ